MSSKDDLDPSFEDLLSYIRDERAFDFSGYKRPSLHRRISKRMQAVKIGSFADYRAYLEHHPDEFPRLFETILINVTSFFRDEVAWDFLRRQVAPKIVEQHDGVNAHIRLWSTGCATGEEAFSLAMVFAEILGPDDFRQHVKIYATDIDEHALSKGCHAEYDPKQIEPVPPDLRERYFEHRNGNYVFRSDLRRSVIFGRHDLIQDPPISKISLLLSRNTLMYFDTATQTHVLENFHFALRDGGYLFLGKSEALAARSELFVPVDLKRRVFAKASRVSPLRPSAQPPTPQDETLERLARDAVVRDAGFESVPLAQLVVDRDGNLALANLQARALFDLSHRDLGAPFQDLEVSYRPVELRSRIERVYSDRHVIALRDVEWRIGGNVRYIDVQITPLTASSGEVVGAGVTFTEVTRYRRLQEALQDTNRDAETAYEELKSSNEELETTNEELQSTNEALETMNEELNERSTELNQANSFLGAVLASLQAAVIVVNGDLLVQAWNTGARELWGLHEDEVAGKHLLNLDIGFPLDELRQPIRAAIADGSETRTTPFQAVNRRGHEIEVQVTVTPLAGRDGAARGAIVMMQAVEGAV